MRYWTYPCFCIVREDFFPHLLMIKESGKISHVNGNGDYIVLVHSMLSCCHGTVSNWLIFGWVPSRTISCIDFIKY